MAETDWEVAATVDEPTPLVLAFVAQMLAVGARRVQLFLDRDNPEVRAALSGHAQVELRVCDAAYWAISRRGKRPRLHVGRQSENAKLAFRTATSSWLLSCDCDEFLRSGAPLEEDLAALPDKTCYLRLPPAERVFLPGFVQRGLFDGAYRRPLEAFDLIGRDLYGDDAPFYKKGVTGHAIGKSLLRVGRDIEIGLHIPKNKVPAAVARRAEILHFDGITPLHYTLKLLRRATESAVKVSPRHGAPRVAQFSKMAEVAQDAAAVKSLVGRLKYLPERAYKHLRGSAFLDETPFDPSRALEQLNLAPDLSAQGFDAALRARDGALIAATGLEI